ncbi:glycine cleavage system aminomethyltransferase GcvT [Leucobacter denitrificans]|uniref:Aminomethyltransferase n=1 Tax=Leucobacter denitrificans TaxID=683042 RepID=A0A7G9S6R7_9MICO|nr:glycine cleavage system aminomethyltransferase GcvT [Leucobacter denitrificans]QNN63542.1 glycine cleavage system aminomethyltransferase GcvT [Leucobacter denitrificans]
MTKHTALHAEHEKLGASFTDFGGWDMPLRYDRELAEHHAVREAAGLFDLSHMGEVWVTGDDAATYLNTALVGNLAIMKVGKAKYSLLCNEAGGIIDDLIIYRVSETRFLVVPNAGNAEVVADVLAERAAGFAVEVRDASSETSLIAVQGPASEAIVSAVTDESQHQAVRDLAYYAWTSIEIGGVDIMLARTGYTGEDGFELFLPNERAAKIWQLLLDAGSSHGLIPCGLAARDSLRLEAGMPLYGNELGLDTTPFEAGLGGVVSFKKSEDFIGRAALEVVKAEGSAQVLVGLSGAGRRAGRSGYAVHAVAADGTPGEQIGQITSGLPSPTLGHPVALARIDAAFAEIGTAVAVDLRGKPEPFEVVSLPFYQRQS